MYFSSCVDSLMRIWNICSLSVSAYRSLSHICVLEDLRILIRENNMLITCILFYTNVPICA